MGPALRSGRPRLESDSPILSVPVCSAPEEHTDPNLVAEAIPDVSVQQPVSLDTLLDIQSFTAQPLLPPANIDDFNGFWPPSFAAEEVSGAENGHVPITPPFAPPNEPLRRLADLQANIIADLETVKNCRTADKCPEAINATCSITGQNLMVGRMLGHSTTLIDILNHFQPTSTDDEDFKLSCDAPITVTLVSCYVSLVRIYRTIFSCIVDSLPFLSGIQHPTPQLFPGMHLGGFKLEARVDLQVQILVKISEDMLRSIETKFGLPGDVSVTQENIPKPGKAAHLLLMMLDEEASEQPQLYEPRGHCKPLKELLASLRDSSHGCQAR